MEALYGWVRNITFYLIFMTVLTNILPDKKYEKYIRLFAGMVLLLLVLKPLTSGLRLDDKLAYYFESISFQKETEDLKKELTGMEKQRLTGMVSQYEEAVALDLERMAGAEGFYRKSIQVTIESDQNSERFGMVNAISMVLTTKEEETAGAGIDPVALVEMVTVETETKSQGSREEQKKENTAINELKTRIAQYYGLEAQAIEIQLEDE